ncbi:hypothetical protein [Endozoicomonas sp. SCSIO W0465]|uniref:hypothetical protein n=1 Tax=Endozoicomonas sp. SCSIO W0465 TaxID=2918516 RepID=UPI0020764B73|nr:hypothetical protein [Endozoicomonas sp. SCSIO W0465]USE38551.1 hypothetical protein MJO57_10480 [Endozoicomonas sp. SCSIO W0465]
MNYSRFKQVKASQNWWITIEDYQPLNQAKVNFKSEHHERSVGALFSQPSLFELSISMIQRIFSIQKTICFQSHAGNTLPSLFTALALMTNDLSTQ